MAIFSHVINNTTQYYTVSFCDELTELPSMEGLKAIVLILTSTDCTVDQP